MLALIVRVQSNMQLLLERALVEQRIGTTHLQVLGLLADRSRLTARDICEELRYDSGYITRVVRYLEIRQLLRCERDLTDRRLVWLMPTESGLSVLRQGSILAKRVFQRVLRGFTPQEAESLNDLLFRMIPAKERCERYSVRSTVDLESRARNG
jgi:DNA-binding MarR family transcriptional regulator